VPPLPPAGGVWILDFGVLPGTSSRTLGDSDEPGDGYDLNVDPNGTGLEGITPGVTTAGAADSIGTPATTSEPQQAPFDRLKTRLETRPKKPQGLNRPVPLEHWLKGPD